MYDIIIIGAGPAGLTAAIYACRANKSVLVLEKGSFGGQITYSPKVENIPGFISLTGNEFADKLVEQALSLGAEIEPTEVFGIRDGKVKTVITEDGEYEAQAVIIATGAKHRLLGLDNEENLIGNGISFCAVCDGAFYKDEEVAVIGGGNSALQEAILLSDIASKVYVVQNLDYLTGEKKLADQLYSKDNVEIITGTVVKSIVGDDELDCIYIEKTSDGTVRELPVKGMFVAIGLVPQNSPFENVISLDAYGYADADESCQTSTNGIFVAGDCRKKKVRQVATAVSDGAISALAACDYIKKL